MNGQGSRSAGKQDRTEREVRSWKGNGLGIRNNVTDHSNHRGMSDKSPHEQKPSLKEREHGIVEILQRVDVEAKMRKDVAFFFT